MRFAMDYDRVLTIFKQMRAKTIMVIGDIMLDHYIWGKVDRISPEAPVPIVTVYKEDLKLGGAGNVANNLKSLGVDVVLTGTIGPSTDLYAQSLLSTLWGSGISSDWIVNDSYRGTIVKTRIIAHTQQVVRMDKENRSPVSEAIRAQLVNTVASKIDDLDAIIISDYAKGVVSKELVQDILEIAWGKGIPVCVDPKDGNFPFYERVDLITPNLKELSSGAGIKINDYDDMVKAALTVIDATKCKYLLVTRGESGMSLFDQASLSIDIPTSARHVYDVTGAGDTVIACYTLAMVAGALPYEAAVIANIAAGIVVGEVGASSVTWDALYRACLEGDEGD
jgi:D-beta-D-heptose 7-phosphate kinase/D-beta-D-heptose 1-phosphate adenosyltransferase